jgi:ABC-type sugar transport system ATPase subunit
MASIRFDKIGKSYGETEVIKNLDFSVNDGEFMVFVGPYDRRAGNHHFRRALDR